MQFGRLTFHVTMLYAAVKFGCTTSLRVGAQAVDIIQPSQHANGRAYANLYFKFSSGEPYRVQNRHRLRVPDFTQPLKQSCSQWHASVQQSVPEARIDYGKLRQGEIQECLKIYGNKEGIVDAAATLNRIRQQSHSSAMQTGGIVSTFIQSTAANMQEADVPAAFCQALLAVVATRSNGRRAVSAKRQLFRTQCCAYVLTYDVYSLQHTAANVQRGAVQHLTFIT